MQGNSGPVGAFDLTTQQLSLNKTPNFSKVDGTTQHCRAWKMHLGKLLCTVNTDWVPLLDLL